jgi:hypothetical protein
MIPNLKDHSATVVPGRVRLQLPMEGSKPLIL